MGDPIKTVEELEEMSDEDFSNLPEPTDEDIPSPEGESTEAGEEDNTDNTEESDDIPSEVVDEETASTDEDSTDTGDSVGDEPVDDEESEEAAPEKKAEKSVEDTESTFDYKAEYEKIMTPFKANGKTITPKSPEEIQQLAQMGANYHKKMSGMAPARKALKLLQDNGLLEEGTLDHLIEVSKGDPDAINKLLRDKKINPLDVDVEKELEYTPKTYTVNDTELQLDEVLADISESPSYEKTLNVITKDWDDNSRHAAGADPEVIRVINAHMDNGVYDKVADTVDYERSLGKLRGMSDLDAYKEVGNRLEQAGAFQPQADPGKISAEEKVIKPKADSTKERERLEKKKKATATGASGKVESLPSDFNPMDLSDDEFAKFDPKLLGIK